MVYPRTSSGSPPTPFSRLALLLLAITLGTTSAASSAETATMNETGPASSLSPDEIHATDEQLRGFIGALLAENPRLASEWSRSRSLTERVSQESSLPDLMFSYRYFVDTPETRVGPQEHAFEVSQGLPWGGKRDLQARRAEALAQGATWEAEELEWRLVSELKRAYYEAAYLQEALRVNAEERELLSRFERIALTRYSTGGGIQQNVVKVQTDLSRLEDLRSALRERQEAASRRIAALVGRPEAPLTLRPIELDLPELAYDRDELERLAISEHPRVRAIEKRVDADRTWADRRKLESRPDFRVGAGYVIVGDREDPAGIAVPPQDNGKDVLSLTVGVDIPLYRKRIHASVAEAQESERANLELLEAVRDRLRFDIQDTLLRVDSLGERGRLFEEVIIPQAQESLASAEAAYTTDRLGFLDLLDAERVLFQSRLSYHRLVSDLWIALSELELHLARAFPPGPSAGSTP